MEEQLLRELVAGQKEQTELLRRHLTRIKFSLRALLLLMTGLACGMWLLGYEYRPAPVPSSLTVYSSPPPILPSTPTMSSGQPVPVPVPAR